MIYIILIYISTIIILLIQYKRVEFDDISKYFRGDLRTHLSMINSIEEHQGKIPIIHKRAPSKFNRITYPRAYHWIISKLNPKYRYSYIFNHNLIINIISYTVFSLFYFIFINPHNSNNNLYFLFSVILVFAPYKYNYVEARNYFSPRSFAELLLSVAFIIYLFFDNQLLSYFILVIIFSISNTSTRFSRQVILFSAIPITLIFKDPFYIITVFISFVLPLLFDKTYKVSLTSHYYFLKFYWTERYKVAIKYGWIPFPFKKILSIKNHITLIKVLPRINIISLFIDYPIIWSCMVIMFIEFHYRTLSYFIIVFVLLSILTSIGKLRIFGEGKRYLEPIYIVAIFYLFKNSTIPFLLSTTGVSLFICLFYIIIGKYLNSKRKTNYDGLINDMKELINFLNNDNVSLYYCLDYRNHEILEFFTNQKILKPAGVFHMKENFDFYNRYYQNIENGEIDYKINWVKIEYLKKEFGINKLLIDKKYSLSYNKMAKLIFNNKSYSIYDIK